MSPRILIVEDEPDLLRALAFRFEQEGFAVTAVESGEEAKDELATDPVPALVLLDLMLPDVQGTEIVRAMRGQERTREVPVVMLTAKSEEIDRVVGFELGADDYVAKPFSMRELVLRVRAVLRRRDTKVEEAELAEGGRFGRLQIDVPAHRVFVDESEVHLTALEFKLLKTFTERRGRVQTRERLLEDVWDVRPDLSTRTVDTHVKRLREKLGGAADYIETLRGVGYRFLGHHLSATHPLLANVSSPSPRILVLEPDPAEARTLVRRFEDEGFDVRHAADGAAALDQLAAEPAPDLLLLAMEVRDVPGTELCRRIRTAPATRDVRVIMLSSRAEEIDRVVGFEVGADDYVVRPASLRELVLRVRAVLRPGVAGRAGADGVPGAGGQLELGRLRIDRPAHEVYVDGAPVHLTALEFRLLLDLVDHRGRVETRDALIRQVWGEGQPLTPRTVDTHIRHLRQKLGPVGHEIETLRGVGYRFRDGA